MLRADLYDYSDAHTFVKGVITVTNPDNAKRNKIVAFKNIAPLVKCISKINNVLIDNAEDLNVPMPMYNLIEYSDNYSDTLGSLWQFERDKIVGNANVTNNDNAPSFKYKESLIDDTVTNGKKDGVKTAVPLKY